MLQSKTILNALPHVLKTVDIPALGKKSQGKVRDIYFKKDQRILITTDRQSAFDVILGDIPFKGTVLNLLSQFWFEKTKHIIPNHMVAVPDPNVMVTRDCEGIPVEMVVRGYISGVTKTSIWYSYERGERMIYGLKFPDGLKKNQKLKEPVITPTTHGGGAGGHDDRLTREEILERKLVDKKLYKQMEDTARALFTFGSELCKKRGLILVDTKYEFGLYNGKLMLIDEIHTPDSSRFWIADTYNERLKKGLEPDNFDKEFLRLRYAKMGYRGDGKPPKMPRDLIAALAKRYISVYEKLTGKIFKGYSYPIEERITKELSKKSIKPKTSSSVTYAQVGDNYYTKDPINKLSQDAARATGINLKKNGMEEVSDTRGESAFVWKQGNVLMASVLECLGTKNLVADAMRKITGKTYYDVIAHDTVATFINDLTTVGAKPLVVQAYWAVQDNEWLQDRVRMTDFINGWKQACDIAGATWGGGETPTMKGILQPGTVDLAGSVTGIIKPQKRILTDKKLNAGDRIVLLKSNGPNANGISLTRAIAAKLPHGYETKLPNGKLYGEEILKKTNIYARLIQRLFAGNIGLHYIVNITGHGLRKIMRARPNFTYRIERIFEPQPVFLFIQKHAQTTDYEMYQSFNMGMDYALFMSKKDVKKALSLIKRAGFEGIDAGVVEEGERQVIIEPKNLIYSSKTLNLRS